MQEYQYTFLQAIMICGYLPQELNIPVFREPQSFKINNTTLQVGHGDGLGPGEASYKFLKAFFANKLCQWLFKWLHPNLGFALANFWSRNSRLRNGMSQPFTTKDQEWIYTYCKQVQSHNPHDIYVFGHRHLALELEVEPGSIYYNIGEWIKCCTYGVFDDTGFKLAAYDEGV